MTKMTDTGSSSRTSRPCAAASVDSFDSSTDTGRRDGNPASIDANGIRQVIVEIWTLCLLTGTGSILLHASSMVFLATIARRVRIRLELHRRDVRYGLGRLIGLLMFICVALGLLHVFEAAVWAAIYVWVGAVSSFGDSLLYSIDTMATRGASGINLTDQWRLLGAIEASAGVFLFGMSTAFLFSVMQADFSLLLSSYDQE
ncbi:two pore domain potassium channel family protein [Burkholderia lata]|uniref:two pore domain potassium channel family protein n=1 Tax=Burkholderia lata (strain ATCC 17760 / DSM 23089 / LMG 22485 / NCIMB 9086 / R18194 / 383) TaxID=482957 RepID=UPI0020C6418C|nr:two pore domain potassium channel family protein [Burkholderia lata]